MSAVPRLPTPIAQHVDALAPGTRLGEFELQALLGVGGFGMVYQAFDHSLQRCVAIKEYMPAKLAGRADGHSLWVRSSSNEQSFQAGLASFVDEARLLARFDHPSLVKVFRFWEANHTAYMVMPLYRGMTLKQARAHMRAPPPEAWLRQLLWSVTSALRLLHDGQTLHRDISPDNIFLQDRGPPVLLDLGAARHTIGGGSHRHAAVLKVNYAPLEQYADAAADMGQGPWSDLYALGAMVHGCLCNDTPLPATQRAVRDRMLPMPRLARAVRREFGIEYSRPFVDAIGQCLVLKPQERPQSVAALLQAMGLTAAPIGLESFDFRAALGDLWAEPQSRDAPGVARPMVAALTLSRPQSTAPAEPRSRRRQCTRSTGRGHAPAPGRARAPGLPVRASGQVRMMRAVAGSVAAMAVLGGLWWGQDEQPPPSTLQSAITTELAEPARPRPLAVPPLAARQGAGGAAGPLAEPPQHAYILPVSDAGAARAAPAHRATEAAPLLSDPAAVRAMADPLAAPAAVPPRPAPPAYRPGPDEDCASAGFFARPACIQRECQKPDMASYPICEESRRRREAQELRQLYAQ